MSRPAALVLTLAVLLNLPGHLRSARGRPGAGDPPVSATRIRADVEFLADDLLEGREAATRGYDLAARYVATVAQSRRLRSRRRRRHVLPAGAIHRKHADGDIDAPDDQRHHDGRAAARRGPGRRERLAPDRGSDRAGRLCRLRRHGARVRARRLRRPRRHGQDRRDPLERARQAAERAARALRLDGPQAEKRRRPRRRCRGHGAGPGRREALPVGTGEGVLRQADADLGEPGRHAGSDREAVEGGGLPQPPGLRASVRGLPPDVRAGGGGRTQGRAGRRGACRHADHDLGDYAQAHRRAPTSSAC